FPPATKQLEVGETRQASQCYYGKVTRIITSWTDSNLGRQFEVCPLSKMAIASLLRNIGRLEEANAKIQLKSRILVSALVLSWLIKCVVIMA
ncbi:hypothetical protein GBA52_000396, partial [Prunus armeniaca]